MTISIRMYLVCVSVESMILGRRLVTARAARLVTIPRESVSINSETVSLPSLQQIPKSKSDMYWKLAKGHLTVWVAVSAFPGYLIAVTWPFSPAVAASVLLGTALTSACAQSLNQLIEVDRDARMLRTRLRPLPTGQLTTEEANQFAVVSGILGTGLLVAGTGQILPAGIAASTAALYACVYTPLKVKSEYNTHVGALVGSLPVLIGFAAAGVPMTTCWSPWVLFSLQTLWQFPHFYALAWLHKEDYARGGYRMFPMQDATGHATARMCVPYLCALTALPFGVSALGVTSWMFAVTGLVPNLLWIKLGFVPFWRSPTKDTARKFFLHSLWYLIAMYAAFVVHASEEGVCKEKDWREAFRRKMLEVCPHAYFERDVLVPPDLCPIREGSKLSFKS